MKSSFGMVSSLADAAGDAARSGPLLLSRTTAATRFAILVIVCLALETVVVAQSLPYIPTTIFLPGPKPGQTPEDLTNDVAYIFSPQDGSVDLLALNFSSSLKTSSLSLQTLSSGLPFLDGSNTAFIPSLADNGSLIVYAGDCSSSANSSIWTFNPASDDAASLAWVQEITTVAADSSTIQMGPGFLGGGFSFSTTLEPQVSPANTFVYGGMCPDTESDGTTPQAKATYSNQMLKVSLSEPNTNTYTIDAITSKGPPVAEAGFTFTGLSPSTSNRSGTVNQQINYVLLGGHTQWAFVNMSTVALWSLPEESWGFVSDIGIAGSGTANTELAVKSAVESIDSRSGHTAVLNEAGTALIVLGGWVGDLTQAASPQLAILEIGAGYGGEGDWQWSIPENQPPGSGIYGHGATLLPGNIMMVYGGYGVSSTGSESKRQTSTDSSVPMFLNLTSMAWTDDYTNPDYTGTDPNQNSGDASEDAKRRLGLGLGLGLGFAVLIAAIIIYLHYRRRLFSRHSLREATIRSLAQDTTRFLPDDDDEMMEHNHGHGWYMGGANPYMRDDRSLGYQTLQTSRGSMDNSRQNWFGDIPPPMHQMARKPVSRGARGQYQPTPTGPYDSPHSARGPGAIHPIYEEADEDEPLNEGDVASEPMSPVRDTHRDSGQFSDPFLTPTHTHERPISFPPPSRASATPSPEERRRTDPEVQDWMMDVDAADALLSGRVTAPRSAAAAGGRTLSPTRRGTVKSNRSVGGHATDDDEGRTGSNISESNRSILSIAVSRSGSTRSHFRGALGGATATATATAAANNNNNNSTENRGGTSSSSSSAPTFNTAKSSFPSLQAEGPSLLMGRDGIRDGEPPSEPGSPSKYKHRRSWMGSFRRVFSGPTPSPSPPGSRGYDDDSSPTAEASDHDARLGGLGGLVAAEGLLRRKGGRGAWEQARGAGGSQAVGGSYARLDGEEDEEHGGADNDDDDDEWDIEKAIEKRLVQVMFTVPKERLRVVNAGPDVESGEDVVVVDPEQEDPERDDEGRKREEDDEAALQPPPQSREQPEERDLGVPLSILTTKPHPPIPTPSPISEEIGAEADSEKEALRHELDAEWERVEHPPQSQSQSRPQFRPEPLHPLLQSRSQPLPPHHPQPDNNSNDDTYNTDNASALEKQIDLLGTSLEADRLASRSRHSRSHSRTPESAGASAQHSSDGDVFDAEAVRIERPRTAARSRVLAMVESIESFSKENSPTASPMGSPKR